MIEGERVALLGFGTPVLNCLAAASLVARHALQVGVADARFRKPLDHALIRSLAKSHEVLITVEARSIWVSCCSVYGPQWPSGRQTEVEANGSS